MMAAGGGSHSPSSVPTWEVIGLSKLLTKKEEEEINEVGTGTLPGVGSVLGGVGGK